MTIEDIMTGEPRTCSLDTNLKAAAALMLDGDCGIPVALPLQRQPAMFLSREVRNAP